jgi:hypothetical protein
MNPIDADPLRIARYAEPFHFSLLNLRTKKTEAPNWTTV